MSAFEDSYKSQLQGVSQQVARERLDGQVTAQDNMLSDTVTNLRRRPGASFAYQLTIANATADSILAWDTDLAGVQVQVILNIVDGTIRVLDSLNNVLASLASSAYLTTSDIRNIQVATVGDEFFLVNTTKTVALGAGTSATNPTYWGFFYVKAGAFSKTYEVRLTNSRASYTATYTTPDGTHAGDAALSTPEYIVTQLANQLNGQYNAGVTTGCYCNTDASYAHVYSTTLYSPQPSGVALSTPSGNNYMIASNSSYLRQAADLPSRLPASADGYIVSVGELKTLQYYKYSAAQFAWLETGEYTAPLTLTNIPISLTKIAGTWQLLTTPFEGRFAGDVTTNPEPDFVSKGISGIGSYQGRLVILSGSMVSMSASLKPRRFYRSTVTAVLDNDTIGVGASADSSAAYIYAVPFQRDLLLFSEKYQAVVPGGSTALTPRTASVVVTSTYDADMTSKPLAVGRTLMYPAPRSTDFFGLLEMLPSQYTQSQYTSFDSTAHIPKYMAGRCRFSVSSSVANMVLFAPTGDRNSLIVHEYTWQQDQKVQQSWHKWTFKYPIAAAYFAGQTVHIIFVNNGLLVCCTVDPRSGTMTSDSSHRPFMDMSSFITVTNNIAAYPAWINTFDSSSLPALALSVATGPLAGEPVGFTVSGGVITTTRSFPSGSVAIGFPYTSTFSPTPPMVKDANNVKVSSNKMTVLRFALGTNNSAEYMVAVSDSASDVTQAAPVGTMYFSSTELALGQARNGMDTIAIIPARVNANSASLVVSTSGTGEMNIVSLEYVARYHEKIKRATKQ